MNFLLDTNIYSPILGRTLVQPMMTAQPFHHPVAHPLGQLADIVLRRSFGLLKAYAAGVHLLEHAVGRERMQVRIDIQRAAESLRAADQTGFGAVEPRDLLTHGRPSNDRSGPAAVDGAEHLQCQRGTTTV